MNPHLSGEHAKAKVWLSALTPHQLESVLNYVGEVGAATVRTEIPQLQAAAAGPPVFAFMDLDGSADAENVWFLSGNFLPFVIANWLSSDMDARDYYEILVKGAGIPPQLAQRLADEVVTPDGAVSNFAKRAVQTMLDLPIVRDIEVLQKLGNVAAESATTIIESVGAANAGRDNAWEGVQAGKALYNMLQRERFNAGQYAYEGAIHGAKGAPQLTPGAGDPFDDEEGDVADYDPSAPYGYDESGDPYTFQTALRDALGATNIISEAGEPIPPDPRTMAAGRAALEQWLDDVTQARQNGYHTYAGGERGGGFFKKVKKKLKKLGRKVIGFVKKAVPLAANIFTGGAAGLAKRGLKLMTGDPVLPRLFERAGSGGSRYTPLRSHTRPSTHRLTPGGMVSDIVDIIQEDQLR